MYGGKQRIIKHPFTEIYYILIGTHVGFWFMTHSITPLSTFPMSVELNLFSRGILSRRQMCPFSLLPSWCYSCASWKGWPPILIPVMGRGTEDWISVLVIFSLSHCCDKITANREGAWLYLSSKCRCFSECFLGSVVFGPVEKHWVRHVWK